MEMENNVAEEANTSSTRGCGSRMKKCWDYILLNTFLASSLTAVALGVVLDVILKSYVPMSEHDQIYIGFPGEILMRMLQVVTVPLIVTSVITGVSGLNVETSRRIAVRAAAYFVSTTLLSVATGLILVLLIKPGVSHTVEKDEIDDEEALSDLIRNVVPQILIEACFRQYKTERVELEIEADEHNFSLETNATEVRLVGHHVEGANVLGLIVWSCVFGVTLNRMGEKGKVLVQVFTVLNEATKCVVNMILRYLPFGLLFMIAGHVVEVHDWETTLKLGKFMVVVVLGLIIHGTITLPVIYFLCVRRCYQGDFSCLTDCTGHLVQLCHTATHFPMLRGATQDRQKSHSFHAAHCDQHQHGRNCPLRSDRSSFHCPIQPHQSGHEPVNYPYCDISNVQHRDSRDPSHRSSDHSLCFDSDWFTCEGSLHSCGCRMDPRPLQHCYQCPGRLLWSVSCSPNVEKRTGRNGGARTGNYRDA